MKLGNQLGEAFLWGLFGGFLGVIFLTITVPVQNDNFELNPSYCSKHYSSLKHVPSCRVCKFFCRDCPKGFGRLGRETVTQNYYVLKRHFQSVEFAFACPGLALVKKRKKDGMRPLTQRNRKEVLNDREEGCSVRN